nr:hypothetical protein [Tanacetum cinerariifolium]
MCEMACQIVQKKQEEKKIEEEQAAKAQNSKILACCDDDDDYNYAITPNEPIYSISMGDEHLNTILATESDEFIKSCVENLIDSLLDEFTGELTLLKSIPSGIDETDCYHENDIRLIERLLYDNSSPRPPEEFVSDNSDADIKSFSPSPILVEDSESHMEEIDLPFTLDDPMPPGIKEDDYDSERDVLILEELLDNYSLSLPIIESYHFDIPSFFVLLQNHQMLYAKCPMMIHGKNIPILDVPLFHFTPLISSSMGELGQAQRPKTSASWETPHAYQ